MTEPQFHKFVSALPSCKYVFRSGKVANFVGGQYITKIQAEIDELNEEIAFGHPHISVDKNEVTVASDKVDPMAAIKKRAVEEYLAEQAKIAAGNAVHDTGASVKEQLKGLKTSATVGAVSAESQSK